MQLSLSPQEWDILSRWADRVIRGGHWGNGVLTVGEEDRVLQLLKEKPEVWYISLLELRVLQYWAENTPLFTPMEKELVKKIQKLTAK